MKTNRIDTIIFDLGGVLVDWNPEYVYKDVFEGDLEKMHWFLNNVCTTEWNIEQDAGRSIAEGISLKTADYPEFANEIAMFYQEWPRMFSGPIKENLALFRKLRDHSNYKLYALTNWCAEKWDKAIELFPFFKEFDGSVVSGQEHTRKPFDKIYQILLNRYSLSAENSVFIDDNLENTLAATRLGINAIHFQSHAQLIEELEQYGVII